MNIDKIKRKLLVKYPFFGSVITNTNFVEDQNCVSNGMPTAATDGINIYYHPAVMNDNVENEQLFLFAHEVCHIAFNHILRSENKIPELWNIATDAVINALLKKDGIPLAKYSIDIPDAINYDAEELYEKLLKENKEQNQNNSDNNEQNDKTKKSENQSSKENNQKSNNSSNLDNEEEQDDNQNNKDSSSKNELQENTNSKNETSQNEKNNNKYGNHNRWSDAVKKHKENQSKKETANDEKQNEIKNKQQETEQLGERKSFKKNAEEKKKQLEELKKELLSQAMGQGFETNHNTRSVGNIGIAKPLIDWRYVLKETINYNVDWSYKNATIEAGVINAQLEEYSVPETEIVLDTSGSIKEELLRNFLRECKNILQQSKIKVGCFDTEFYGFYEIRTEEDIEKMEFKGGGGTNFDVAVDAFTRRVDNKIIFTDGDACMPKKIVDAIWIVFGEERINPKGGKVIQITKKQLEELYLKNNFCKKKIR